MGIIACNCKVEHKTEEVLWTNPSPSSAFSGQWVTLSDNITNYRYLRIEGILTTSNTTHLETYTTPSYLVTCVTGGGHGYACLLSGLPTNSLYSRALTASSNQIYFNIAETANSSSSTYIIPTKVVGII